MSAQPPPPGDDEPPAPPPAPGSAAGGPYAPGAGYPSTQPYAVPPTPPTPPSPGYAQPGYGPPTYGQPGYGYPQGYAAPPATTTSSNAVIALVLAICSFVVCPVLPAVIALVFAGKAKAEIEASRGWVTGDGMVTAAKIVSWINIGLYLAVAVVVVLVLVAAAASSTHG